MEIKINDKPYKVKYSIRAMLAFEQITSKNFEIKNLTDLYVFYYSMVLAGMNDEPITFDEFIEACDNDPELTRKMAEYMNKHTKVNEELNKNDASKKKAKR